MSSFSLRGGTMDARRKQIIDIIEREFIGPDPLPNAPELIQSNGEEILSSDPPNIRYIAGVLFPQKVVNLDEQTAQEADEEEPDVDAPEVASEEKHGGKSEYLQDAEELMNMSNAYQQSAISMTAAVKDGDEIVIEISAGVYTTEAYKDPKTGKDKVRYPRTPISWKSETISTLPTKNSGIQRHIVQNNGNNTKLRVDITYRFSYSGYSIYTFTLLNTNVNNDHYNQSECFFQVKMVLNSKLGFMPLPDSQKLNINDQDYLSNQLLYRDVHSYAIGHGCAANWDEEDGLVKQIRSAIFPYYEIKPIVPSKIPGVDLDMFKLSDYGSDEWIIEELTKLCNAYSSWIDGLNKKLAGIKDTGTAVRHIDNCKECLKRMKDGVSLLKSDQKIMRAFKLMNRAMLLQQLHYNLPLKSWKYDGRILEFEDEPNTIPVITDQSTWYGDISRYGHWRPFQLAFVLINLRSMAQRDCSDRDIVDLIWFPTGGGKTEAYLGLSAYTIFIRRLMDKNNTGTTILMRYTLRLLTSQQYERASAMICACESIRTELPDELGDERITIGLWVGEDTSPNKMADAVSKYDKLYNGTSDENPFIMLKCPWCGSQMGVVSGKGKTKATPGYKKISVQRKKKIVFQCSNSACDYSKTTLPLFVIDDDIYENAPTLLLGTVDKFAMLPFRPEAQTIFGLKDGKRITAPDLIIQDELHLISGPLGSMVGHYETMIHELCSYEEMGKTIHAKVIASTATISRAAEQCNALYGCGIHNVKQFPPSGLDAKNSFFAEEDSKADGRLYVGILANAATSIATTTIRLYAALLYAAKALNVANEDERDPYWTNVGYFNSIRELGQTETWIRADIEEYLHIIYKRRYEDRLPNYTKNRRYIYSEEELTSRIRGDKIPFALQRLSVRYPTAAEAPRPVDICLATNMISVGVDVPRLGLMTVSGQPKTTSEYIQSTSRVGRSKDAPGLVFTVYNPGKPRDKSHYEHFVPYHSRIYCNVEPTSVTPFSGPLRDRALHALMIGLLRMEGDAAYNSDPPTYPSPEQIEYVKDIITSRILEIDPEELDDAEIQMESILDKWYREEPQKYHDFSGGDELPLMFPAGSRRNELWGEKRSFPTPTSMRSVDSSCEARVLEGGYEEEVE